MIGLLFLGLMLTMTDSETTLFGWFSFGVSIISFLLIGIFHLRGKMQKIIFTSEIFKIRNLLDKDLQYKWGEITYITYTRKYLKLIPVWIIIGETVYSYKQTTLVGYNNKQFISALITYASNARINESVNKRIKKFKK